MDVDTYDIYHLEYSDNILETYYKIKDYCDPAYVNIHNNSNFSEFFNMIYNNVDVYNSSRIIKKIKKKQEEDDDTNLYESSFDFDFDNC